MKKIEIGKIYFISNQDGMWFIKPIKKTVGWAGVRYSEQVEWVIFHRALFLRYLDSSVGKDQHQEKNGYLEYLLNNSSMKGSKFEGIVEVPIELIDYVFGKTDSIEKKYLNWPFSSYAFKNFPTTEFDINQHRSDCLVRMPNISEIRDWIIGELV